MKKVTVLLLSILLLITGCSSSSSNSSDESNTTSQTLKMPEYEYSDKFFNTQFSEDKDHNCYFRAGKYFYKLDKNQHLTKLFDVLIKNKYLVMSSQYYDNSLYLNVMKVNNSNDSGRGVAKIDTNGNNFKYLFDVKTPDFITNMVIDNNLVYFSNHNNDYEGTIYFLKKYSLKGSYKEISSENFSILDERNKLIKNYFPDYPYDRVSHIYNNDLYSTMRENKHLVVNKYNPLNNIENKYVLDQVSDSYACDLVNNNWYIASPHGFYKYNIDFSNCLLLIPEEELSSYTFSDGSVVK